MPIKDVQPGNWAVTGRGIVRLSRENKCPDCGSLNFCANHNYAFYSWWVGLARALASQCEEEEVPVFLTRLEALQHGRSANSRERTSERSFEPLLISDLKELARLAEEEYHAFFDRNGHLEMHKPKLIAAALCQGAAMHYLVSQGVPVVYPDERRGIKDFDIHFFYPVRIGQHGAIKRVEYSIGHHGVRPVDFAKTYVPDPEGSVDDVLSRYLSAARTATACYLRQKGVVGLYPSEVFGQVFWPKRPCGLASV